MATETLDRDTILKAIERWPLEEQVTLARTILDRASAHRSEIEQARTGTTSIWDALYGIASNGQEPPSDEQVAQWLDEHKMEKYGR